ncbi:hypothetical protein LQ954_12345 [Sphingomonas sp. IC-11]|uniref:hypothetical protein n=1 Tax=Sphingomonas sp. IC-11 TaxID=2898528 RepID=UPI001E44C7B9|nr:hypothetical protein [Sphingomonas sp. IC-11]MCD2316940.1 hypothetical protein [Sphingomonas sp. IC-11]
MSTLALASKDHVDTPLLATLNQHLSQAIELVHQPELARPINQAGYLEGIWIDRSGLCWLVGWMIEDAVLDRSVIILDTARTAGGLALSLAPRADLAPGAKAFVAMMSCAWQADPDLPPQIVLADGSGRYLEPLRPTPLTSPDAVLPIIRDTLDRATGPHRAAMLELLQANRDWSPQESTVDRVQVDEIAVLPGFGAFVNGWALSPRRRAEQFILKAGTHIIPADPRSQSRFTRTDLIQALPNVEHALETAAFVTLFRGPIDRALLDRLTLRVVWDDGTITNTAIAPAVVRVLGVTSPLDSISRFYPAVEVEHFFADFARQAAIHAQSLAERVQAYDLNKAGSVLLLAAPRQPADIFLLFDQACQHVASLPEDWGVAIVARPDDTRGLVLTLFAQLQRTTSRACSLFFTSDTDPTSDVIEGVATVLSCERLAWVDGRVSLTSNGWREVAKQSASLALLAINDPLGNSAAIANLNAFVADVTEWKRLRSIAPPQIGGIQLPPQDAPLPVVPDAALYLAPRSHSSFTLKINEALHRAHG